MPRSKKTSKSPKTDVKAANRDSQGARSKNKVHAVEEQARRPGKAQRRERAAEKLSERMHQQEVVAHLSQIALASADLEVFMNEAVYYLSQTLDVDYAKILELEPGGQSLVLRAGYGWDRSMKIDSTRFKTKSSVAGINIMSSKPLIINDMRQERKMSGFDHLRRHMVMSGISVIIPGIRRPFGVLGVYTKALRQFAQDDLNFVQAIANVIALSFERNTTENELRRFQYMADHANIGISLIDKDGRIQYANKIIYERLGLTKEEYMRRRVVHRGEAGTPLHFRKLFNEVQKKQITPFETFEIGKGKRRVPLEMNLTGVTFEGEPYMFAVSQDIADRLKFQQNLKFLAEAGLVLGSSLDYEETLDKVAKTAVSYMADWCSVDMLNDKGELVRVVTAHNDPKKVEWAKEFVKQYPVDLDAPTGVPNVIRTGKPEFYPEITEEMLLAAVKQQKRFDMAFIRDLLDKLGGLRSTMTVPLKSGKRTIGAISFVISESARHYDEQDLAIALELGTRASLAIENARLYSEIEKQKERLNNIIANMPGVVWESWIHEDPAEQRINFVSEYVEKMTGYSGEEWLKGAWERVVHPEDLERVKEEWDGMVRDKKPTVQRLRWVHKNGKVMWVEAHNSVILGGKGEYLGTRGVIMDVTDRLELERRKDEFISMASHELKTPVTTLKVFTQILREEAKAAGGTSYTYLSKMDTQITRLTDLINDLLDLSRIQTGKLSFKNTMFSMDELVLGIVEELQPTAPRHKIAIDGRSKRKVFGDKDRIGQVIINIVSNAIKYSPRADRINIGISDEDGRVVVSIKDFGIGISREQQEKIFDRFYQITDGNQKTFPGLGIGLYISDQIMRKHGGSIEVESSKGKGSTFRILMPVRPHKVEAKERIGQRT